MGQGAQVMQTSRWDRVGCTSDVKRRLLKTGLRACVVTKKHLLTAKHMKTRLKPAKERHDWNQNEWDCGLTSRFLS